MPKSESSNADIVDWLAQSSTASLELRPGATYVLDAPITIPENVTIRTNGARFVFKFAETPAGPAIVLERNAFIEGDLTVHISNEKDGGGLAATVNRAVKANGASVSGITKITADDQQPNNAFVWSDIWEGLGNLTVNLTLNSATTIASSEIDRSKKICFDATIKLDASPDGVVFEVGGGLLGAYLGFNSSQLVFRAGGVASSPAKDYAEISVPASDVAGRKGTFYGRITPTPDPSATPPALLTVELWFYDSDEFKLYFLGRASSEVPVTQWASTGSGGFLKAGGNVVADLNAGPLNNSGLSPKFRLYNDQNYADFEMHNLEPSQASLSPSALSGALVIQSTFDDGTPPVRFGAIEIENFDFALTIDRCGDVSTGDVNVKSYVRGVRADGFKTFAHGGIATLGRSYNAVEGHIPGQNGIIVSNGDYIYGGAVIIEDSAEHGIRIGGEGPDGPSEGDAPLEIVRWRSVSIRRSGQSGVKIKGSGNHNKIIDLGKVFIEDAGSRALDPTHRPGLNEAGLLVEGVQELICTEGVVQNSANSAFSCNNGIDARGVRTLKLGSWTVINAKSHGLSVNSSVGGEGRNLEWLSASLFAVGLGGRGVSIDCQTANIGAVDVRAFIRQSQYGIVLYTNSDVMSIGAVYAKVLHSGLSGPEGGAGDPKPAAVLKDKGTVPNLDEVMVDLVDIHNRAAITAPSE